MTNKGKEELRRQLRSGRQELSAGVVDACSQKIIERCIGFIPWDEIKSLHTYVPVQAENEIDTWQLLEYVWAKYPNVQIVVPSLNANGTYDSVIVTAKTEWIKQGVRIPKPKKGEILPSTQLFDVVIVPMLGFDAQGYRLGHGKGWYDRFLATQPQSLTVGLCYQSGFVADGLPHEPHDVQIKQIVTENQKYTSIM